VLLLVPAHPGSPGQRAVKRLLSLLLLCIAAAHEQFTCIHQMSSIFTRSGTPQSASTPYQCCALLSILITTHILGRPQNCPFTSGDLDPHLTQVSFGLLESTFQMASRSVQPFLQGHNHVRLTHRWTTLLCL